LVHHLYELVIDLRPVLTDSASFVRRKPVQPNHWKDPFQKKDLFTNRTSPLCWLDCWIAESERERAREREREGWKSLPGHNKTDGPRMNNFYGRGDIEVLSYLGWIQRVPVVLFKELPTAFLPCFPRREGGEHYPPPFFWKW